MPNRFLLSLALAVPALAGAQTGRDSAAVALPSVAVTATRVTLPARALPVTVTTFTRQHLRDAGITQLVDVVRLVPGATVLGNGSAGGLTSVFFRGGESDYVQVLVDGMPVNAPGGAYDFGQLTLENVERVEVLRGPGSVLYGSDGVSAVIQIITRSGAGRGTQTALIGIGSHATRRYEVGGSGGSARLSWAGEATRSSTDGILAYNNQFTNNAINGGVTFRGARGSLAARARYGQHTFHYPTNSAGALVDSNQFVREQRLVTSLDAGWKLTPRLELRARGGLNHTDRALRDRIDFETDPDSYFEDAIVTRALGEARLVATLTSAHVLTFSGDLARDREESAFRGDSEFGPYSGALDEERRTLGLAAQLFGNLGGRTSYSIGARHDDNSEFGGFTTFRAAGAVRVTPTTSVRASIGNAFKAPTFYENFASGFVVGNPALRPERTQTVEAGVQHTTAAGRVTLAATVFAQRFRDLIQYVGVVPENTPNFANLARATASGVELEVGARFDATMQVIGSYTYLRTNVTDAGADEGESASFVHGQRLLRRPTHAAALTVRERIPAKGAVDLTLTYTGARDDRDFAAFPATPLVMKAFTRLDVGATRPLGRIGGIEHPSLVARIENVTNARYQQTYGFRSAGRTYFVGIRIGE